MWTYLSNFVRIKISLSAFCPQNVHSVSQNVKIAKTGVVSKKSTILQKYLHIQSIYKYCLYIFFFFHYVIININDNFLCVAHEPGDHLNWNGWNLVAQIWTIVMLEYMCCKIINDWELLTVEEISARQTVYVLLQIFGSRSGNRDLPESSVRLCFIFNQRVFNCRWWRVFNISSTNSGIDKNKLNNENGNIPYITRVMMDIR